MKPSRALVSAVALLCAAAPASFGAILAVDMNDRSTTPGASDNPDTAPGFLPYVLTPAGTAVVTAPSAQAVGAFTVTLTPFDDHLDENTTTAGTQDTVGAIDDRDRADIPNSGALTLGQLYDDVIFAQTSCGPTGGMDLKIEGGGLSPNTLYLISIYAFDSGSTPAPQPRTANWLDGNSADALVLSTSFSGSPNPTADDQFKFSGLAMTDANGALLLKGRNTTPNGANGATSIGVFLNGFEINVAPEPASLATCALATLFLKRRRA